MEREPYYLSCLRADLSRKQRTNTAFSLRSYARFLKLQPPTLSAILSKKRPFPKKRLEDTAKALKLSPKEREQFISSATGLSVIRTETPSRHALSEEAHFRIIAEWEHYAFLSLMDTKPFRLDTKWIAKRMGISEIRVHTVLSQLENAGLIRISKKKIQKTFSSLETSQDVASTALRKSHMETLQLAQKKLEEIPVKRRDFSAITVAVNMERLAEAKQKIKTFRNEMEALLEGGSPTEVYQLAIQLYPLTVSELTE